MDPHSDPAFANGVKELAVARHRFTKRIRYLFDAEGRPKHPPEESARRLAEFERQFERTARKVEKRAQNVEASALQRLDGASGEGTQGTRRRLEAGRALKQRVAAPSRS